MPRKKVDITVSAGTSAFRSRAPWLDRDQAAGYFGVHRQTVGYWYRTGRLPGTKPGGTTSSRVLFPIEACEARQANDEDALRLIAAQVNVGRPPRRVKNPQPLVTHKRAAAATEAGSETAAA